MSEDRAAFIAKICENPFDNTPRLVFADWLDEQPSTVPCAECNGSGVPFIKPIRHNMWEERQPDGTIRRFSKIPRPDYRIRRCESCGGSGSVSNGNAERAEFIRLQIELAAGCDPCPKCGALRARERELWDSVRSSFQTRNWTVNLNESQGIIAAMVADGLIEPVTHLVVARGFVSAVRCTLADWAGGTCERCGGRGSYWPVGREAGGPAPGPWEDCYACGKSGRTPARGPRIVAEQPVERVEVTVTDGDFVFEADNPQNYFTFQFLNAIHNDPLDESAASLYRASGSREFLLEELSNYLLNWARCKAGLPPLTPPESASV